MHKSLHHHPLQNHWILVKGPSAHLVQYSASTGLQSPPSLWRPSRLCLNTSKDEHSLFVNVPLYSYSALMTTNRGIQNLSWYLPRSGASSAPGSYLHSPNPSSPGQPLTQSLSIRIPIQCFGVCKALPVQVISKMILPKGDGGPTPCHCLGAINRNEFIQKLTLGLKNRHNLFNQTLEGRY